MDIPEYIILTDEKMKLHMEAGLKLMAEERSKVGLELYTGEVEAVYASDAGADLYALDDHAADFKHMIGDMFERLPMEKKILEGGEVPKYDPVIQNGFSSANLTDEQWKNVSASGSLTTGPIPVSTVVLSSFVSTLKSLPPSYVMASSDARSTESSTDSCSERLDDCGSVTDVMNESSECTVPMISERTDGMLSEVKWSPPLRSMESSDPSPLDVKS